MAYIDAERAKRIIIKTEWENKGIPLAFCQMIDLMPTADVVEVKHGEWTYDEQNECFVCSECGLSALNNYRGLSVDSEYCPHCGAKMDGKGDT